MDAMRDLTRERLTNQLTYAVALNRVDKALGAGPAVAREPATLEQALAEIAAFDAASATFLAQSKDMPALFRRHLAKAQYSSAERQEILDGVASGAGMILPRLIEFVQANRDLVASERGYLELLGKNRPHWQVGPDGRVLVDSDELLAAMQVFEGSRLAAAGRVQQAMEAMLAVQAAAAAGNLPKGN
jgi:hypothetical protein